MYILRGDPTNALFLSFEFFDGFWFVNFISFRFVCVCFLLYSKRKIAFDDRFEMIINIYYVGLIFMPLLIYSVICFWCVVHVRSCYICVTHPWVWVIEWNSLALLENTHTFVLHRSLNAVFLLQKKFNQKLSVFTIETIIWLGATALTTFTWLLFILTCVTPIPPNVEHTFQQKKKT